MKDLIKKCTGQLKLTENELLEIGFEKCKSIADELNEEKILFKIPTINGYFYYNQDKSIYIWYHKTIIGDVSNNVHLNIHSKAELYVLLNCFNCNFELIF